MAKFEYGSVGAEEAAELGSRVAALAKAGLPLGAGLRAMAGELAGRSRAALAKMADRLDRGASLEEALQAEAGLLPGHLRAVVSAAARCQRLGQALDPMIAVERQRLEVRRRVWLALAYPGLLAGLMLALHAFFSLAIVPQLAQMLRGYNMDMPAFTQLVVAVYSPGCGAASLVLAGLTLALAVVLLSTRGWLDWSQTFLYRIPVVGPLWRFQGLAGACRLIGLLLELELTVPEALRRTAEALREGDLKKACRRVAERVERGEALTEAMVRSRRFPARIRPILEWGEQTSALPEAFRVAAEIFEGQVAVQGTFLETIVMPVASLAILFQILFFIIGMFAPLVAVLARLTG